MRRREDIVRSNRDTARIAGLLFLATFVTAIDGLLLYDPILNDPGYINGAGADTRVALGALLEVLLAVANIGTAVVLYPILRRQTTSGLVPRRMSVLGLVGGPLIFVSAVAVLFGAHEQTSATAFLLSVPEILWKASLGFYLTFKGFRSSPVLGASDDGLAAVRSGA